VEAKVLDDFFTSRREPSTPFHRSIFIVGQDNDGNAGCQYLAGPRCFEVTICG
jgi:hypothetical protein